MKPSEMKQPSKEAVRNMLEFFARTSVPRIMAAREKERAEAEKAQSEKSEVL